MKNKKLQVGIIGLGRWGKNILKTFSEIENVNLAAVSTRNKDLFSKLPQECKIFYCWEDLISNSNLDGLIISTPAETHFKIAKKSLDKGINTLVEKPLTLNSKEAQILCSISIEKKILLMTEFTQIFNPKFNKLKDSLDLVGDLQSINTESGNFGPFRKKTPVLFDWGSHELSILISLIGSLPEKIYAKKIYEKYNEEGDESNWEIFCQFKNNLKTKSIIGNNKNKVRKITVSGDKGILFLDDLSQDSLQYYKFQESTKKCKEKISSVKIENKKKPLLIALESFFDSIRNKEYNHWSLNLSVEITNLLSECIKNQ